MKKDTLFLSAIILVGLMDLLTTVVGITFFGATETNPLLAGIAGTNMILMSVIKLIAVTATGLAFYKAIGLSKSLNGGLTKRFVDAGFSFTFIGLTVVVISNLSVLMQV
jgi:hydrogenase-4 membrane subunit HyfE